ncbi:MAG: hypothetical protein LUG60_07190 [Erysipelotrichaceae bacterium]|nr:hypothetical protein [Erysipelotrichaceae bacterium]
MDIEKIAVDTVNLSLSKTDYLTSYINVGEKTPVFDGPVYVYKTPGNNHKNKDLYGIVNTQVKGQKEEKLNKRQISYSIELSDLEVYRDQGGIMFFVVNIDSNRNTRIYYEQLLPFDVNKHLANCKGKKTKSIKLKPFPNDIEEITNLFLNFVSNSVKQSILKRRNNITFNEFSKQFRSNFRYSLSYNRITSEKQNPFDYFFTHDTYLYAVNDDLDISIPLEHFEKMESISCISNVCIKTISGISYNQCQIKKELDKETITFGKNYTMIIEKDNKILNFNICGTLKERIKALKFYLDMFQHEKIFINEKEVLFTSNETNKLEHVNTVTKCLQELISLQDTLDLLDITIDLEMDNINNEENIMLDALVQSVKNGQLVNLRTTSNSSKQMVFLKIANLQIGVCADKKGNKYLISNFNDGNKTTGITFENSTTAETTIYNMFKKEHYLFLNNINFRKMIDSLKNYNSEGHYEVSNLNLLEILLAYDESINKNLLDVATEIVEWLYMTLNDETSLINLYQCYIRYRNLDENEINKIIELLNSTKNNLIIVGCHILLGNKYMIDNAKNKLTGIELEALQNYPIYNLIDGEV